jgi:DNA-binding beta-propeller fold protein YncE
MSWTLINPVVRKIAGISLAAAVALSLCGVPQAFGKDKKDSKNAPAKTEEKTPDQLRREALEKIDLSKIVWPNPPAITRIRYLNQFTGEKFVEKKQEKKKSTWMERVAGVATGETPDFKPRFQLLVPAGVTVDSKGRAYVADSKVRAIFIVDTETGKFDMIKNGTDARFQWVTGMCTDDADRLFVGDSGLKHILVFNKDHKVEGSIAQGMVDPGGCAVDNENRLLYVADAEQDLVLVYDADTPYRLIRKIGKEGTKHTSTVPGEFAKPTNVALDQDGNLYVSDTWNDRVEVFDAEGNFIRTFGKAGDGPGYFARPKGIAIDGDGHVWVADTLQDRVQVYTPEGKLLIYMGSHGMLPGMYQGLTNLAIDSNNRVFTTEQFPGRMQWFRYINDKDAIAERDRREAEAKKKLDERKGKPATTADAQPAATKTK